METKSKCPFDKMHEHLEEKKVINIDFRNFISGIEEVGVGPNPFLPKIKPIPELNNEKFIYKGNLKDNKPFGEGKLIYDGIGIFKGKFNGDFIKEKVKFFMMMVHFIKGNGKILRNKIMEYLLSQILIDMKENSKMIYLKEKENYI